MGESENWIFQSRKSLIESALKEINTRHPPHEIFLDVFYVIAKLGLQQPAKNAGLLDKELWYDKNNIGKLLERLEAFLWQWIR